MNSIWKELKGKRSDSLKEDLERDIVVVGGGIAGFLTAYRLTEAGLNVTLIEANTLFSGVTQFTTAHIEALQGVLYSKLDDRFAKLYFESQLAAIDGIEALIKAHKIDCDFKRLDSYLMTNKHGKALAKEYRILKRIGADVEYLENSNLLNGVSKAAIMMRNQAQFEPVKFLEGLPVKFELYENTRIIKVDYKEKILYTENNKIQAHRIIIATNFPIIDVPGWYFLRMYRSSSYAAALEGAKIDGLYQDDAENGYTYRNHGNYLVIGGLDHRTGRLDDSGKYTDLTKCAADKRLGAALTCCWSAADCVTFDGIPFIGYYSRCSENVYVITGFNKWGMANAMAASTLICDMITGNYNPYQELFNPLRRIPFNCTFIKNALCVVKSLVIKPILFPLKSYRTLIRGEGAIVCYHGRKRAVYKDGDDNYHVCRAFCAHLHCELTFNAADKTWDCPCHGSRFDIDGNIITAPTVTNLEKIDGKRK